MEETKKHQCNVCFEYLTINETYFTPCLHRFHESCIRPWLDQKATERVIPCPTCREDISSLLGERLLPAEDELTMGRADELQIMMRLIPLLNSVINPVRPAMGSIITPFSLFNGAPQTFGAPVNRFDIWSAPFNMRQIGRVHIQSSLPQEELDIIIASGVFNE
jgi:hypothetical protein